eukprot:TRINITY_DN7034_c0_g1_i12.p3 TRINITY_DN7034_c0_g1~~TRINITY_DN7034_c0_g1_i12.p3  ORF type:complete len:140 (+),score=40.31 TRINITY_DN7034_c0_g1_i12:273-692(+)
MMQGDINVEEILKSLQNLEGADGYVIFNADGIPLKRFEKKISHEKSVHMAYLFQDLWNVTRKVIQKDLNHPENDVEIIRLRTRQQYEYIITQAGDYTIVVKQLCGKAIEIARQQELAALQAAEAEKEKDKEKEKEKEKK